MSLKEQVRHHFRQADTFFDSAWRYHTHLGHMHAESDARLRTLQRHGEDLLATHPALTGLTRQELHRIFLTRMATSRIQLRNHHEHMDHVARHLRDLQGICDQSRGWILGAMDLVPDPIWDLLGAHVALPTFLEMLEGAEMPVLEALLPILPGVENILQDLSPDKLLHDAGNLWNQWTSGHTGGVGNAPGGSGATVAQGCTAVTPASNHLANYASQCQAIHGNVKAEYSGCGCCQPSSHTIPITYPPYPTAPTLHSNADLTNRAKHIHSIITTLSLGPYDSDALAYQQLAPYLQGLSPEDVQALENIYATTNGSSLYSDLYQHLGMRPEEWYHIALALSPDGVTTQQFLNNIPKGPSHIYQDPPLDVVTPGTGVSFSVWDSTRKKVQPGTFYVIPDASARQHGAPAYLSATEVAAEGFPVPGTYTIVVEVPPVDVDHPPQFITYTQIVVDPKALASVALLSQLAPIPGIPADPVGRYDWMMNQEIALAKKQGKTDLANQLQADRQKADRMLQGAFAIPAVFVKTTGAAMPPLPLSLYAKQLPDGSWEIIDATDPTDIVIHKGEGVRESNTLNGAWDDFIQNNYLPDGQIAAQPPQLPPPHQSTDNVAWTDWNKPNNQHSAVVNVEHVLGILSLLAAVVGLVYPPAFLVSALLGVAAAGTGLYNQYQHGDLALDNPRTDMYGLLILLNVLTAGVGGLTAKGAGAAGEAGVGLEGVQAVGPAAADGSQQFTLKVVAKTTLHIGNQVIAQGTVFTITVLLSGPYASQIVRILESNESADQKAQDILRVLGDAYVQNGLHTPSGLLAGAVGFAIPALDAAKLARALNVDEALANKLMVGGSLTDDELNQLAKRTGLTPDLLRIVAADPDLAGTLQWLGNGHAAQMQHWYDAYLQDVERGRIAPDAPFGDWLKSYLNEQVDVTAGNPTQHGGQLAVTHLQRWQSVEIMDQLAGMPLPQTLKAHGWTQAQWDDFKRFAGSDCGAQSALWLRQGNEAQMAEVATWWKRWEDKKQSGESFPTSTDFGWYLTQNGVAIVLKNPPDLRLVGTLFPGFGEQDVTSFALSLQDSYLRQYLLQHANDISIARARELALLDDILRLNPSMPPDVLTRYLNGTLDAATSNAITAALDQSASELGNINLTSTTMQSVKDTFAKAFYANLGKELAALPPDIRVLAFRQVQSGIPNPSTRGSIGEAFVYYLCNGPAIGLKQHPPFEITEADVNAILARYPKLTDSVREAVMAGTVRPDLLNPDLLVDESGDGLDVKTFRSSDISDAQLLQYGQLLKKGLTHGGLRHLNYLFLPGDMAGGTAAASAAGAFTKVKKYGLADSIHVYYMDDSGTLWMLEPTTGRPIQVPSYAQIFS